MADRIINPKAWAVAAAFLATVPLANYLIGHVGQCAPHGPCVVPVGFGLMAPSGVLVIGAAMVLRDALRELTGPAMVILLVLAGAALSFLLAPPILAVASFVAFAVSECADTAVYEPLRKRGAAAAVLFSGVAGAVVDSVLFLGMAFGSMQYLQGQVVGKVWASLLAALILLVVRRRA